METKEIDARINALVQQRNSAMDQVVVLAGQLVIKDEKILELEEKIKQTETSDLDKE